mgnify:CR=1 FL=1
MASRRLLAATTAAAIAAAAAAAAVPSSSPGRAYEVTAATATGAAVRVVVPASWEADDIAAAAAAIAAQQESTTSASVPFMARCGTQLCVPNASGGANVTLRLAGANIYWLGLDENVPPGTIAYPTPFRILDALTTAAGVMGATVVRSHTLGISTGNPLSFEPALGVFNGSALAAADYAVYVAGTLGLRLQIPLTDNYDYYHGSYHNFCDWLGVPPAAFYTNTTVIAAFSEYVTARLAHVNAFTGVPASADPTIMMWETGNELSAPTDWTATMAALLKGAAPNQLVMDGNYGINLGSLLLAQVDAFSDHFYPPDTTRLGLDVVLTTTAGKLFVVGEFGWPTPVTPSFLAWMEGSVDGVAYDAYWSLFGHDDNYGYVQHNDGFTLHWPGDNAAMAANATLLRTHAYVMSTNTAPPPPAAAITAPPLVTFANATVLAWRGTAGAATYSINASTVGPAGPFAPLCTACYTDNDTPIALPLPPNTTTAWLVVAPANVAGVPGPVSAVVNITALAV